MFRHSSDLMKVVITGGNGWIGFNARIALEKQSNLKVTSIDRRVGLDRDNRYGIEGVSQDSSLFQKNSMVIIDLASDREKFATFLKENKPDCVLHLAGILENQDPADIEINNIINKNVLESCAKEKIPVIAASSIMVMYGAAMRNDKVRAIFEKKPMKLRLDERIGVDTPLDNTEETLKIFNEDNWKKNLAYIKTKERLEELANRLVQENKELTMVTVRFGWTGIVNPYALEKEAKYTEIPAYLAQEDLQSFITTIVSAVLSRKIKGYKCYVCVSHYPDGWVNQENTRKELRWEPKVHILEKFHSQKDRQKLRIHSRL